MAGEVIDDRERFPVKPIQPQNADLRVDRASGNDFFIGRQGVGVPDIRLLVTDYHLGDDQTGVQVISAVREKLGQQVPAILITGDTSSAMRDLRCDALLRTASKPINPDELLALIRELSSTQATPHRA